ncbi:uncharacterized protein LOC106135627 [Amyelois transitella]|uniref:uncharacterized protein LOC106135627 n=1 Tax=Amyelois transitella TaxID=680683 RepID=UPI00067C6067|nr:uncharacterized protein LOC106135627 [Amyelois transitella]
MKDGVLILLFCVVVNKVTAPAPFNLPKTNLPQPKPVTSTTPKLPKWNGYTSKTSGAKPMKDNAYLATLVKRPPKDKSTQIIEIKKEEESGTNVALNEKECRNTTKILFAEEIVSPTRPSGKESKENEILSAKNFNEKETAKNVMKDLKLKLNDTEPKKGVKLQDLFKPLQIKPKVNNTDAQFKPFEIPPTMIPIFRPNQNLARNQITKDLIDTTSVTQNPIITQETPVPKENPVTPKDIKPNLNPKPNAVPFSIPCHRASDVLDDVNVKHANLDPMPKDRSSISQEPNQVERPEKLETDESVAVIFKPKNISLLNVYGDMLKKITLTVLVPYHISKLGT